MTRLPVHFQRIAIVAAIGTVVGVLVAAAPAQGAPSIRSQQASSAATATAKLGPGGRVIVLMKNRSTRFNAKTATQRGQAAAGRDAVREVAGRIDRSGGTVSQSYSLINAVAARLDSTEATALAADSNVAEIVPDEPIKQTPATANGVTTTGVQPTTMAPSGTCKADGKVRLEPEALEATRADSDVPGAKTARSLGYTGHGVTVGFIADGLDIHNPDFIRNGHSIFSDYEDFSGEGPGVPTGGDEAFLDASAIGAQGNNVYDVSHFSDLPVNEACNIRIEGEAPGVDLVGLNIFGEEDTGFNSSFIQAIQYAATVDHVNVLNESLGGNPYPDDNGSLDAVKAANDAAVAAGTTVVASSGDAGITNTIGSPATDPNVISVGASTTYRFYLTTGYGGARLPGITGWVNNNISALSSGGFDQSNRTVDLVAPGDLNFALCSKNLNLYFECADFAGNPIGVEESGGTSESAPVTSGVAALVIQAYRQGHGGASPTPAEIKAILTSTSDDIDAPADQQGAGLVDAYKAVQLAKSYQSPNRTGHTLALSTGAFSATAAPSQPVSFAETVTNEGTSTQHVRTSTRALGSYATIKQTTVTLSDAASRKYVDFQGLTDNYEKITFTVPAGVDRLAAAIAFRNRSATDLAARVRMDLVDPKGRLASYSLPQGDGNYGRGEVADPTPGTWTAYISSRDSAGGGTQGPVHFAASVAKFVHSGTASPANLTLAPGQSGTVTLSTTTPSKPGNAAESLQLHASAHTPGIPSTASVPVTLRSLIPTGPQSFTDTLTGGNGRAFFTGQTAYYNLDLPAGLPELNAYVRLANDRGNQFYDELVSPSGDALAFGSNNVLTSRSAGLVPRKTRGAQLHVLNPEAGQWTVIVVFAPQVSGNRISEPFTVSTDQTSVPVSAKGLPDSAATIIPSGTTKFAHITVTNPGTSPEAVFLDPRLRSSATLPLTSLFGSSTTEPLTTASNTTAYLVPTETTAIAAAATTTGPADIQADLGYNLGFGDPDLETGTGTTVTTGYAADRVAQGAWAITPTEVGPFDAPGAAETVHTAMVARTRQFDTRLSSPTGDLWLGSINPSAAYGFVVLKPGQNLTLRVRITATGGPHTVHGTLFIDDANLVDFFGSPFPNGNEVAALPYTYTVR